MKKKLLREQVRKFLSRKSQAQKDGLQQKLADLESGKVVRTVTQVDHPGGSYEVVEYGDEAEETEIV